MEIKDLWIFRFAKQPFDGCEIQCPHCLEFSNHSLWKEAGVYCQDCEDEHTAMTCPKCNEDFDSVWGPTFILR